MKEVVLVVGSETLTGRKLIEKQLSLGNVVVAVIPGGNTQTNETETENLLVIEWNRLSWFSAKAVIREALIKFGRIDSAWLFYRRPESDGKLTEIPPENIDSAIDMSIRGNTAMTREILNAFNYTGTFEKHGTSETENTGETENIIKEKFFAMVMPHQSGRPSAADLSNTPMENMTEKAFRGLADSVMQDKQRKVWFCGLISTSPDAEGFVDKIISLREELPKKLKNKWFLYNDKNSIFNKRIVK